MKTLLGHERQRQALERLRRTNRTPSTLMLAGHPGIGKNLVAQEFARALLCQTPNEERPKDPPYGGCGTCENCRLFDAGNSTDFQIMQCADREQSNVEAVRELLYRLNLNSFAGGARVALLNDAEQLSTHSANILLKALEEPRPNTYFILVCSNPSRMPQTVLSRCQIFFFDALTSTEVEQVLRTFEKFKELSGSGPSLKTLAALSEGSVDGIEQLAEHYERWEALRKSLHSIAANNGALAIQLSQELAKDKEALPILFQFMRSIARQAMRENSPLQARWGLFLWNALTAEQLILERNIAPLIVLQSLLLPLAGPLENSFTAVLNSASVLNRL